MDSEEKKLYIKLAYGYYQNKEYKKAIDLYEKIYKADTEDFNVLNMLSDTYLKANLREKAIEAYVDTLAMFERKGHYDKIIRLAKKIARSFPDDQRVKGRLKNALRFMMREAEKKSVNHDYTEAREILESIQEYNSEEYPVDFKLKELATEETNFADRSRKKEEIKRAEPQDTHKDMIAKFDKMAQNYITNGDYDGAVETYITALKLAPGNEELRAKLHKVYVTIAQENAGEKVWEKLDKNPKDKLAEAKKKALEERQAQIMQEEEERAKRMLEEEAKIQHDYDEQELAIIQAAADELKNKLEEAQKMERLKEDEIQRIMKEQEDKKRDLLEKLKREAIDKFKKQKEAIQAQVAASRPAAEPQEENVSGPKPVSSASLMSHLKKAYDAPKVGAEEPDMEQMQKSMKEKSKDIKVAPTLEERSQKKEQPALEIELPPRPEPEPPKPTVKKEAKGEDKKDEISDDIGEAEPAQKHKMEEIIVNDDTLDSLITMTYIYINQGVFKEAMRIYNKLSEKYPNNKEVKQIIEEISKRQGS